MAISANSTFELRTTGSDSNGGGYVAGASGVDYSQQDSAQATLTTAATVHTTTTQINVPSGQYTVSANDVGNIYQVNSGTATVGLYEITAVDVPNNRWTVDRAVGTAGQTCAGSMGGALATLQKAVNACTVSGNRLWIKAGTHSVSAVPSAVTNRVTVRGYNTTRGDCDSDPTLTRPVIQANVSSGNAFSVSGNQSIVSSVDIYGVSSPSLRWSWGIILGGNNCLVYNCKFRGNFTAASPGACIGFSGAYPVVIGCEFDTTTTTSGIVGHQGGTPTGALIYGNYIHGNSIGIAGNVNDNAWVIARNLILGNTGIGINCNNAGWHIIENIIDGNTSDGVRVTNGTQGLVRNNLLTNNGGYGLNASAANIFFNPTYEGNFYYNNTSGARNNLSLTPALWTNIFDVDLSGDPYTNRGGGDYSLNNTAGAGASVRAAGYPKRFVGYLSTAIVNYMDGGALQHQDSGGAGGMVLERVFTGF